MSVVGALRRPFVQSLVTFGGIAVAGFVAIGLAWRASARTLDVSVQVPVLVSGGIGGVLLVVIGVSLVCIQVRRRCAALEAEAEEIVLDDVASIVQLLEARSAGD